MAIPLYIYILCILHHIAVSMESDADDAVEYQVPETHFSYVLILQVRLMHVPMLAPSLGPAGKWERHGTMWLYIGHYRVDRRAWPLNCEWMWMAICKLEGSFLVPAETGWWFLVEAGHAWTLKWCWNVVSHFHKVLLWNPMRFWQRRSSYVPLVTRNRNSNRKLNEDVFLNECL